MQNLKIGVSSLFISLNIIIPTILHSQSMLGIEWQKCLGGYNNDVGYSIIQAQDDGFVIVGETKSFDGDVSGAHEEVDSWVVKINSLGIIEWQKCLGGSRDDILKSIALTSDGGYVVVGSTVSNDGDVSGKHYGPEDIWIVKMNAKGVIMWQKCLGGSSLDFGSSIIQTKDGGFVIAGNTSSNDGDVFGNHGDVDAWLIKLDSIGDIQWQKCFGGTLYDEASCIIQTLDGGYIFAGSTYSNDGDVFGNHSSSNADGWIVKCNPHGEIEWQKCIGGSKDDELTSIIQIADGYIVAGETRSSDGDVEGFHRDTTTTYRYSDGWIVKIDTAGTIVWQKCLGGTAEDILNSVLQTSDSGFITAGYTVSTDGDITKNFGLSDAWVIKLSSSGKLESQNCFGGSSVDAANSIIQTFDGKFVFAGYTMSNDDDVTGLHSHGVSNQDFWVVKLSNLSNVSNSSNSQLEGFSTYPNPVFESGIFKFTPLQELKYFEIFDILGRSIWREAIGPGISNVKVDLRFVPAGIYFANIGDQILRFVKN